MSACAFHFPHISDSERPIAGRFIYFPSGFFFLAIIFHQQENDKQQLKNVTRVTSPCKSWDRLSSHEIPHWELWQKRQNSLSWFFPPPRKPEKQLKSMLLLNRWMASTTHNWQTHTYREIHTQALIIITNLYHTHTHRCTDKGPLKWNLSSWSKGMCGSHKHPEIIRTGGTVTFHFPSRYTACTHAHIHSQSWIL